MGFDLQNQSGDELIRALRKKQQGKGYGAEGTCKAGNWVYGIVYFNVPMITTPTINISNAQYQNCSSAAVWKKSKYAFVVRAIVTADGDATLAFDWGATTQ